MRSVVQRFIPGLLLMAAVITGCAFDTEPPRLPQLRPASNVVINEVFTLPRTHPSFYCWIEFLNPTQDTVDIEGWTVAYQCQRFGLVQFWIGLRDSNTITRIALSEPEPIFPPAIGTFDVPFSEGSSNLKPNALYTIVSSTARLLDHTEWGPGDTRFRRQVFLVPGVGIPIILGPATQIDTIFSSPDSILTREVSFAYEFILPETEQLVLKDQTGRVVDVVRYGNYQYPVPDPYPGNQSLGTIPEFESLSRYAGGFYTGNTTNDFYVSGSGLRPIPHWYSQLYKP